MIRLLSFSLRNALEKNWYAGATINSIASYSKNFMLMPAIAPPSPAQDQSVVANSGSKLGVAVREKRSINCICPGGTGTVSAWQRHVNLDRRDSSVSGHGSCRHRCVHL